MGSPVSRIPPRASVTTRQPSSGAGLDPNQFALQHKAQLEATGVYLVEPDGRVRLTPDRGGDYVPPWGWAKDAIGNAEFFDETGKIKPQYLPLVTPASDPSSAWHSMYQEGGPFSHHSQWDSQTGTYEGGTDWGTLLGTIGVGGLLAGPALASLFGGSGAGAGAGGATATGAGAATGGLLPAETIAPLMGTLPNVAASGLVPGALGGVTGAGAGGAIGSVLEDLAGTGSKSVLDNLFGTAGGAALMGSIASLVGGLLKPRQKSFEGTAADPVGMLSGFKDQYGALTNRIQNQDFSGVGRVRVQTPGGYQGGGLPLKIGLTGQDTTPTPAGVGTGVRRIQPTTTAGATGSDAKDAIAALGLLGGTPHMQPEVPSPLPLDHIVFNQDPLAKIFGGGS